MGDWPLLPVVLALPLTWIGSVIERGYRIRQAEKQHPLRAIERSVMRAKEGS